MPQIKKSLPSFARPRLNNGTVLFVSIIFLLVLTVLGLSAMNNSHSELQIAANTQEKNIANQAAKGGLNAVMCLSTSPTNNPFNLNYVKVNVNGQAPATEFNWDWDRSTYDTENISPLNGVTQTNCSISSGSLQIGSDVSNTDLAVATRRTSDGQSLRLTMGNSYKEIACQKYIIDSRYQFAGSGARSYVWAGVCRERIDN